jgi:endo-1,4-beta-xylanase
MRFDSTALGAAVLAASGASAQLNQLAVKAGLLYFGTSMDNSYQSDSAFMNILNNKNEIGQLVPENGQKWSNTEPNRNQFSYSNADVVPNVAARNGQILRCHTFVWHNQLPGWVANTNWNANDLRSIITAHINNVGAHYKGKCYAWDVVNEAADDNGGWRNSIFYRVLGTEFLPYAFKAAKAIDSNVKLYYNDYNLEYGEAKTDRAIEIVNTIQRAGAPIDGVGFQGHLIVGQTPSRAALAGVLRRFTALGVEVAYTEIDIRHEGVPASAAANRQQGVDYANVVGSCIDVEGCVGITVWGFSDKYSWVPGTFPGTGEALIYDQYFNKKPAWTSVSSVLAAGKTSANPPPSSSTSVPGSSTSTSVPASSTTTSAPPQSSSTSSSPPTSTSAPPVTTAPHYGQCGGQDWKGPTVCESPYTCKFSNQWYSQCL